MLPISIFIWLLFEAYNFVINNWAYDALPIQIWQRWPGYALSFATVLPGIFITSELVELLFGTSSQFAASECEALSPPQFSCFSRWLMILGLILTIGPMIWPRYLFAAVWLGPIFLLDPLLGRFGIKSLSSSISSKDRARLWSLMLGGLLCGLMWEFWNYWAGSKWIYTVPFFGKWKLFEMPILGFLGFPPFALECWILYHLLKAIPRHIHSRAYSNAAGIAFRVAWWLGIGIVCLIIFRGIDNYTVIQ